MADNIGALLGLYNDPSKDPSALAHQLRGQQQMGDFYGLSTVDKIAEYGKNIRGTALTTAETTGKGRTAAEQRAYERKYQTGRDKVSDKNADRTYRLAASRAARARKAAEAAERRADAAEARAQETHDIGLNEVETYMNPATGNTMQVKKTRDGLADASNNPLDEQDMIGYVRLKDLKSKGYSGSGSDSGGGGKWFDGKDVMGVPTMYNRLGEQKIRATGKPVTEENLREALLLQEESTGVLGRAKADAKNDIEAAATLRENAEGVDKTLSTIGDVLVAIDAGAEAGQAAQFVPTILRSDQTVALDRLREELTLARVSTSDLRPVSDTDLKVLRVSLMPPQEDEEITYYRFAHMQETLKRVKQIQLENAESLEETGKRISEERASAILRAGGFNPKAPPPTERGGMIHFLSTRVQPEAREALKKLTNAQLRNIAKAIREAAK